MARILYLILCFWIHSVSAQRCVEIKLDNDSLEEEYTIETLRFYLSQLQFHQADGDWISEKNSFHLIDLEEPNSWKIQLPKEIRKTKIDSISFLIGIDSSTNVAGILEGDLDPIKGMYWAWNSGYINFKVEGEKRSTKSKFEYHLGGYLPPYATARKIDFVRDPKSKKITVRLNLKQFLDQIDMGKLNEVMISGPDAVDLSNKLPTCFSLE